MRFVLPYPPSLNRLYRMVNGQFKLSAIGRQYKKDIDKEFLRYKPQKLKGDVVVNIEAYRPQKRGDLDNTLKALLDSIQGICYENDSQIVEINAKRFDDKVTPRIEIEIKEMK